MRKEKQFHFIYKTTNLLNGRYYIGMHSTDNLEDGYLGSGTYLRRALNKHGKENFKREILEFCNTRVELSTRENTIADLTEIAKKECMNLKVGGGTDYYHTIEVRRKISKSLSGKTHSKETIKKRSDALMDHITSEETKKKISNTLKGQPISEERRKKISDTKKGMVGTFTGKKHSTESRKKMSLAQLGVPKPKVKCPHCEKIGGYQQMRQWHFDNCKTLKNNLIK